MKLLEYTLSIFLIALGTFHGASAACNENNNEVPSQHRCSRSKNAESTPVNSKYLLYDVNPGEGFNLRRDVYIRIARLAALLNEEPKLASWVLVLPPWGPLHHWRSKDVGYQAKLKWQEFFDLDSLAAYVPVMEFSDFRKEVGRWIDIAYYLQHYRDTFTSTTWDEKYEEQACQEDTPYFKEGPGEYSGWFWGYTDVAAKNFSCVSVQGYGSTLKPLIRSRQDVRSVMIDRAEVILHDSFGDAVYWRVRRSMRFSKRLRDFADEFRREVLDSDDTKDGTAWSDDWRTSKPAQGSAQGGPYLAVHLRRQDYLRSRPSDVPDIPHAVRQIKALLQRWNLQKVFIATDGTDQEFQELKSLLPEAVRYTPKHRKMKDGSLAIVDQWIAAHARVFVGSYESTFSFRIQEEREILGFGPDTTFNRLCGNNEQICSQPTRWQIIYD